MRQISVLTLWATVALATQAIAAPLPLDVLDTADANYTEYSSGCGGGFSCLVDATSVGAGGGGDHFDNAYAVSVNGLAYGAAQGTAGANSLVLETLALAGFNVSVEFQSFGPYMRQIVTLTNVGTSSNSASVTWHNNTGNDDAQRVIGTSSGDAVADLGDRWVVTGGW